MTLLELNEHTAAGSIAEVIRVAEARQVKALSQLADRICANPSLRYLMLAGCSSAGKTTAATRLCTQLRVNGREVLRLSTDDYFVGDKFNPRDEHGELDYEHVDCVDARRLIADVRSLVQGEAIPERRFDFFNHVPTYTEKLLSLPENGLVVVEGIHALNPKLTEGIDEREIFRIFVDPKPSLEILPGLKPTSRQSRFLRRMVRDNQFRHLNPVSTIRIWPKVLAGEERWILPYRARADYEFDSYLVYELAALKFYVGGLLELSRRELGNERLITDMIRLLRPVAPIDPTYIPGNSILRETIGNSQLDY